VIGKILYQVLRGVYWVLQAASWCIVIRAVLSWFLRPDVPIYAFLLRITEPLIAPFRPLAYKLSGGRLPIDLAPLFSYFVLMILMRVVSYGMAYVYYL
jgi:uncharacterized protein YggT (Ycf19 family)